MERIHVRRIDSLFIELRGKVREITAVFLKNGINQDDAGLELQICELQRLINQTFPQTQEERSIAMVLRYQTKFGRAKQVKYLFETHQASLLLLLDEAAILSALKMYNIFSIKLVDGKYVISRRIQKYQKRSNKKTSKRTRRENQVHSIMNEPFIINRYGYLSSSDEDD